MKILCLHFKRKFLFCFQGSCKYISKLAYNAILLNQLDVAIEVFNKIKYEKGAQEYNEEISLHLCDALMLNKFKIFEKFSIFGSELKGLISFIMDNYNEKFKELYNQSLEIYKVSSYTCRL